VCRTPGPVRAGIARERDTLDAGPFIRAPYASRDWLLAVLYSSCAMLFVSGSADLQPAHVKLQRECWVAHLNVRASVLFAASCSTCAMPLTVHDPAEAVLAAVPSAHLGMAGSDHCAPLRARSASLGPAGRWARRTRCLSRAGLIASCAATTCARQRQSRARRARWLRDGPC
jgi:hypothetical protein